MYIAIGSSAEEPYSYIINLTMAADKECCDVVNSQAVHVPIIEI